MRTAAFIGNATPRCVQDTREEEYRQLRPLMITAR